MKRSKEMRKVERRPFEDPADGADSYQAKNTFCRVPPPRQIKQ
jgi:hypothetical protein